MPRSTLSALAGAMLFALSACGGAEDVIENRADRQPQKIASNAANVQRAATDEALPGTPMAERIAIIGLLNKRNGITRDLSMKPGEALRIENVIVRLRACETTAPWENPPETGAFVQVDVRQGREGKWGRVFSGWLFKERPERNVVEHPIYDVWVKSCAMNWPEAGAETVRAAAPASATRSSAPKQSADGSTGDEPANDTPPTAAPSTTE